MSVRWATKVFCWFFSPYYALPSCATPLTASGNVKKGILFLIILAGLAFLEPRSRAHIMNVVRPISEAGHERAAKRTLRQIAIDVQRTKARTGFYPQLADFGQWLQQTYRSAEDPWGSEYYLPRDFPRLLCCSVARRGLPEAHRRRHTPGQAA
jgi:hypothetical protein